MTLAADLLRLDAEIAAQERALNDVIFSLYGLSAEERKLLG